jgi:hypothetical protein
MVTADKPPPEAGPLFFCFHLPSSFFHLAFVATPVISKKVKADLRYALYH